MVRAQPADLIGSMKSQRKGLKNHLRSVPGACFGSAAGVVAKSKPDIVAEKGRCT